MLDGVGHHQAYLAGVLHGDGWCTRLSLGLRAKDRDFVAAFCIAVNAIFATGIQAKMDERGYWLARSGNKSGRYDGARSYKPEDDTEKVAWLRGMFDSEGNAQCLKLNRGPGSYQRRISMYSTDRSTLEVASIYLHDLGMKNSISQTKNSASHKGTKTVFELVLRRREAFRMFVRIVGSNIERKKETLSMIASTMQPEEERKKNWVKISAQRWPAALALLAAILALPGLADAHRRAPAPRAHKATPIRPPIPLPRPRPQETIPSPFEGQPIPFLELMGGIHQTSHQSQPANADPAGANRPSCRMALPHG